MSMQNRSLKYSLAINEALYQMMKQDPSVFVIGQGVKSPWYVGNTCKDLLEKFGSDRVIDTPVSENAMTGTAVGAAIAGMKAIVIHPRMDFMLYAFDPIINQAANWSYMNGGRVNVPVVIWGIINRGGEQAAQHSQALHALFAHIPGLKIVMPSTAYDAKGLMVASIKDKNPVVFIDDRWLYDTESAVPQELYEIEIGKGAVRKSGSDVTLVSASYMMIEASKAAEELLKENIEVEIIDLRSIKPFDRNLILESVKKTGKLMIVDCGWKSFGVGAEIAATVMEEGYTFLKMPVKRIALPDIPAPASRSLEKVYFNTSSNIIRAAKELMKS
jgi:acetoin:2,6-dichlorophenolindophenol oxidoreductase subunit beta